MENNKDEEINWDEIIEKHFESENFVSPSKEQGYAEEKPQSTDSDIEQDLQEINDPQSAEKEPKLSELDQMPQQNVDNESNPLISPEPESKPEWLKIEDQQNAGKDTDDSMSDFAKDNFEIEETGFVDHDAPALINEKKEDTIVPSIWIQDTTNSNKENDLEINMEDNKKDEIAEQNTVDASRSDQYYEVVLKDAHDALLSGYSQRAIDGYRLLLQENKMNEIATKQLEDDLINYPNVFDLWIILGDSYHQLGMSTKALESYQQAEKHLGNSKGENV